MHKCKDAKRPGPLRFELFKEIYKFLSLNLRNILISPLAGEKRFLGEFCELRNFREGYDLKYSCPAQHETVLEPSPAFVMLTGVRKRLLPLTKREGCDSVISSDFKSKISITNENNLSCKELSALVPQYLSNFSDTVFSRFTSYFSRKRTAFTLAEVLITLGIIGIVAVITLPSLISSTKGRQYKVAREKALTSIGNASKTLAIQGRLNEAEDTNDFVNNVLSSQLKIAKVCDNKHLKDCGISEKIKTPKGETIDMPIYAHKTGQDGTEGAINNVVGKKWDGRGIVTADGFSYNLFYYPKCYGSRITDEVYFIYYAHYACVNAIYDMNGLRKPNQVGKDIGVVTVFYPNETVQAVAPIAGEISESRINFYNSQKMCSEKKQRLPNLEEGVSISLNSYLWHNRRYPESYWTTFPTHSYGSFRYQIVLPYTTTLYQRGPSESGADYALCVE